MTVEIRIHGQERVPTQYLITLVGEPGYLNVSDFAEEIECVLVTLEQSEGVLKVCYYKLNEKEPTCIQKFNTTQVQSTQEAYGHE